MLLYQKENSSGKEHFESILYRDFAFITHLHRDMELALVRAGHLNLCVEGRDETLDAGDMALILSNQTHAYETPATSEVIVCVFSTDFVSAFLAETKDAVGTRAVMRCPDSIRAYLFEGLAPDQAFERLRLKSLLYAACAEYLRQIPLTARKTPGDDLLHGILGYVSEHYRENVTLEELSRALGYEMHYLSRYLGTAFHMNFRRLVNQYRVAYACQMLREGRHSVTHIAMESGFQTIRSFNRAFLSITGATPKAYAGRKGAGFEE